MPHHHPLSLPILSLPPLSLSLPLSLLSSQAGWLVGAGVWRGRRSNGWRLRRVPVLILLPRRHVLLPRAIGGLTAGDGGEGEGAAPAGMNPAAAPPCPPPAGYRLLRPTRTLTIPSPRRRRCRKGRRRCPETLSCPVTLPHRRWRPLRRHSPKRRCCVGGRAVGATPASRRHVSAALLDAREGASGAAPVVRLGAWAELAWGRAATAAALRVRAWRGPGGG